MNVRHIPIFCALVALGGCATTAPEPASAPEPMASPTTMPETPQPAAPAPASSSDHAPAADMSSTKAQSNPEPAEEQAPKPQPSVHAASAMAKPKPQHHARRHGKVVAKAASHSHDETAAGRPHAASSMSVRALQGNLELRASGGQKLATSDYAHTLVYYVPTSGAYKPQPGQFTVYTHNRDFEPDWLAIPEGSTVTFTNLDEVTHNVFSVTPGSAFDLGYKSAGQSASQRFDHRGLVLISCHVHRYMKGTILVVPSRYATTVAVNGSFRLDHLPAGSGTLYFWNPRSAPATQRVQSPFGKVNQTLVISKPAVKTRIGIGNTP